MTESNKDLVTEEVDSRLADLFGDTGETPIPEQEEDLSDTPLGDLKAIILSIEWEINEETMSSFLNEVERLQELFRDDKTLQLFAQLLGSVGKYIKKNRANSHPDAIGLMNSVYDGFEEAVLSEEMSDADKRRRLMDEVNKLRELKAQIAREKASEAAGPRPEAEAVPEQHPPSEDAAPPVEGQAEDLRAMPAHEAFAYALEEIKQMIRAEFRALRAELKLWREQK